MAEQKPIISIDHVSMRFNLAKEKETYKLKVNFFVNFSDFTFNFSTFMIYNKRV